MQDIIDDRFEIQQLIGAGGMGQVFRARDRRSGEVVAVKLLTSAGRRDALRFQREAEALASMRLPGVVRYVAHGAAASGRPYLAMEWVDGETLAERLARAPLTVIESVDLVRRIATTLGAVHRLGVIHRDIKPSNLMLLEGSLEKVMLLDFGIVRITGLEQQLTTTGAILGTPGYMAPEQARGQARIDARADVFALGCVFYKCLTGRAAFAGAHGLALLARVLLEDPPRVRDLRPDVPASIDRLTHQMLAKTPEDRPEDGVAVAAALEGISVASAGDLAAETPSLERQVELTMSERKVVCLVLARLDARDSADDEATAVETDAEQRRSELSALAARHQGTLELIDMRIPLIVLSQPRDITDLATRAAHCALALREMLVGAPVTLVTGRAELSQHLPVGELVERAVKMLERASGPGVIIDEVTAGLLATRFLCTENAGARYLRRDITESAGPPRFVGSAMPFIGRDRELGVLMAELDHCLAESASSFALVTGAAGMGKSRLRHELLQRLGARDDALTIWSGQADPMSAGSAFGLLSSALRQGFGIVEGEPVEARREKVRARVARHRGLDAPRVSALLGEIVGAPFPDEDDVQLRVARRNPMLMNDQIRHAWEEFLRAECADRPVVLVLEDLHWGDLPTVTMVDVALRSLRKLPFWVLAMGRPEVHELFPSLWKGRQGQELRLTPLSRRSSERLARKALGEGASDELVALLVDRADGNAFYLEELVRAASGRDDQGAAGSGDDLVLPETVLAMVQTRLEALEAAARRALRAASVFGLSFRGSGVAALLGAEAVAAQLLDLERREVIARHGAKHGAEDDEYRFRHALLREAAYGMLTERDRRAGHALAGAWLEATGDADPMELAEHYGRGGEPVRAAGAYLRAAEQALRGSDLQAAVDRAERGIACEPAPEVIGALRLIQAEAHVWSGAIGLAEERGMEALEHLSVGSAPWFRAMTQTVCAASKLGRFEQVSRGATLAREANAEEDARAARSVCLASCAATLVMAGNYASADVLLDDVERTKDTVNEPEALAELYQARAFRSQSAGDAEESKRLFEASLGAFEQAGDRRNACVARLNIACFSAELGDFAGAEALLRAALAAAEQMELQEVTASAQNNLGYVLAHLDKLEEAKAVEEAALEMLLRLGVPRLLGNTRAYLGRIALLAGDFAAAEREAREAVDVLESAPPLRAAALAVLAQALLGQGRLDEALSASRQAYAALETQGGVEEGESLIRLTYAEALSAAGDRHAAREVIEAAEALLLEKAARFREPRWRRGFLENVPEHVRTRELARRWAAESGER